MSERTNNYSKQAESARIDFLKWNQDEMIRRFGLLHDDDKLYINFFNDAHIIDRQSGEVTLRETGARASFSAVMSIYDVLCDVKQGASLSGTCQTLTNLSPHSNFGASGKSMYDTEAKKFAGRLDALRAACEKSGGCAATKADVGYEFYAFDFMPIIFQFWDGDDEFAPRINFLFDANTMDYIHFETAWYVAGHLLDIIEANFAD